MNMEKKKREVSTSLDCSDIIKTINQTLTTVKNVLMFEMFKHR